MGLLSGRSEGRLCDADLLRGGVRVHDVFEAKPSYGPGVEPGVVVVLDAFPHRSPRAFVGKVVKIVSEGREDIRATIDDARDHAATISFFFRGLSKRDVPIGSRIVLDE